jgi:hypothetical protein
MRIHIQSLLALILTFLFVEQVTAAHEAALDTPTYKVTIRSECEEGVVDCDNVEYVGVNKKTGATIRLKGKDWIRYCEDDQGDGPGKTPCQHLGYKFKNGNTNYYVGEDGRLEVYQGKKRILSEEGEWDWGQ